MIDDVQAHNLFKAFLKKNEFYANSLDIVLENYYAIFKAGLDMGEKIGYDNGHEVGYDQGYDSCEYNLTTHDYD
jgi:hypothetical protein